MVRFLATGRWARVEFEWVESSFSPTKETKRRIEEAWTEAMGQHGVNLFDGAMCGLESFSTSEERLTMRISRTSYKAFVGTNLARGVNAAECANPLGMSCALISRDGNLMLGRRSGRVAYHPGRVHPFAGALEPAERMDLFEQVRRELKEELNLEPADLSEFVCVGLIEDPAIGQPELVVMARCTLSAAELLGRVDREEHEQGVAVAVEPRVLEDFIGDPHVTPVGVGTVLLAGKALLGEEWFARAVQIPRSA